MGGQPIADLKVAAKSFLDFFVDSQDKDKMGLISFSTAARVDRPMGTNFVTAMKTSIDGMAADGYTNAEDAIDQADGPQGFTDQTGVLPENRVQQFAIFFSDGRPNTIRWNFKYKNVTYNAVTHCDGNCDPGETKAMDRYLYRPDNGQGLMVNGTQVPSGGGSGALVRTGDGAIPSKYGANVVTTRWYALDSYPIAGYAPDAYNIPDTKLHDQMCFMASTLAIKHAQELKDAGVSVYVIALGTELNQTFLDAIASSPDQVYVAPTSQDLQAMFVKLAQGIKLRLVQ
jgi:azurin